jgi:ketosteroid isomerase-like protein
MGATIFRATDLSVIEIAGDRAVARKKFEGTIMRADGREDRLDWQTLYFCARRDGRWRITSFVVIRLA